MKAVFFEKHGGLEVLHYGELPMIDKIFPLHEVTATQQRMEEGKHLGKIVLEVA